MVGTNAINKYYKTYQNLPKKFLRPTHILFCKKSTRNNFDFKKAHTYLTFLLVRPAQDVLLLSLIVGQPWPLFRLFQSFQTNITNLCNNYM